MSINFLLKIHDIYHKNLAKAYFLERIKKEWQLDGSKC